MDSHDLVLDIYFQAQRLCSAKGPKEYSEFGILVNKLRRVAYAEGRKSGLEDFDKALVIKDIMSLRYDVAEDVRSEAIKAKLISLGWTPPKEEK